MGGPQFVGQSCNGKENKMSKLLAIVAGVLWILAGAMIVRADAGPPVPEIDPSFASAAVALLSCGVISLAGRFRRK